MLISLLAGSTLSLPLAVQAQTVTWDGTTNNDWGTDTNWSGDTVPNSTAVIDDGDLANQPLITTAQTVGQTNISDGTLTIASQLTSALVTITGDASLILNGNGTLIGNIETAGTSSVTNGGSANGNVVHIGGLFTNTGTVSGVFDNFRVLRSSNTLNGGLINQSAASATLSGTVNGAVTNQGAIVIGGKLSGTSNLANSGSGTVVIDAAGSWSGLTGVEHGSSAVDGILINGSMTLRAGAGFAIQDGASVRVAAGGILSLDDPTSGQGSNRITLDAGSGVPQRRNHQRRHFKPRNSHQRRRVERQLRRQCGRRTTNNGTWNALHLLNAFATLNGLLTNNGQFLGNPFSINGSGANFINLQNVDTTAKSFQSRIINGGRLDNRGTWSGDIRISDAVTPSAGFLVNSGTITGTVFNRAQGTLSNTGTITAGLLNEAVAAVRGTLNGPITAAGGTLTVNGALASNGAFTTSRTGGVIVNSGAAWTGLTSVNHTSTSTGGLIVNGSLAAGAMTMSGSSTLRGSGRISGDVTVADAIIAPGNSAGTLTFENNLVLGAGSILAFELGDPSGVPGIASDLINVGGDLTLDGTLDITALGGFGEGLYRLINYNGVLTNNGLEIGVPPAGFVPSELLIQTSVTSQANLLVGSQPAASFNFWDGASIVSNGTVDGGTGSWSFNGDNWTVATGNSNGAYDHERLLIFAGTPGTVTVDDAAGPITTEVGLQFAVGGYIVDGDDIVLDTTIPCGECAPIPGITTIRVGDGTSDGANFIATIGSALTGVAGLDKTDLGTLILGGTNTYEGDTMVSGGTLLVNGALGDAEHRLSVSAGAALGGSGIINGEVDIGAGSLIARQGSDNLTFAGTLLLREASVLDFALGGPGAAAALVSVGGDLMLDGTLNITDIGSFGAGLYRLIEYSGELTDNGLTIGTIPAGAIPDGLSIQTAIDDQINLIFGAPVSPTSFTFWDGTDALADGRIDGGNGVWTAAAINWTTADGDSNGA